MSLVEKYARLHAILMDADQDDLDSEWGEHLLAEMDDIWSKMSSDEIEETRRWLGEEMRRWLG